MVSGSTAPAPVPSLPAAATTTTPASHACWTASLRLLRSVGSAVVLLHDTFRTRMSCSSRFATTQSIPATTWATPTRPSAAPTLTSTTWASGAIPTKCWGSDSRPGTTSPSRPAAMPAMWVPCPMPSATPPEAPARRPAVCRDRSGLWLSLPAVRRPSTSPTPVSSTAMVTP